MSDLYLERAAARKAQRAAQAAREHEAARARIAQHAKVEAEEREALAKIPEHVRMEQLLEKTAAGIEKLPGYVQQSEMWTVRGALENCVTALQYILREMPQHEERGEGAADEG